MDNGHTMSYYVEGMIFIITIAIITYPFLSFILKKVISNKWLNRLSFILILLGGQVICLEKYNDPISIKLVISLFFSYILFHLITDQLYRLNKEWRIILETLLTGGLLMGTLTIVALAGNYQITKIITERFPDGSYSFIPGHFDEMLETTVIFSIILIASWYFYTYLLEKAEEKKQRKIKETILEKELVHAQLEALHAKINPHFLYNSLNTIAGLALVDGEKTRQMALALSRFFRYSINKEQTNLICVSEEIEMINTYLDIEKIRFGNQLDYKIECDTECEKELIPRMLLQPLVENSIKHGWNVDLNSILIRIVIRKDNNRLIISVKDSGAPFKPGFIPGYGLQSIYDKLELLFPNKHDLSIISHPEKEVRIMIKVTSPSKS